MMSRIRPSCMTSITLLWMMRLLPVSFTRLPTPTQWWLCPSSLERSLVYSSTKIVHTTPDWQMERRACRSSQPQHQLFGSSCAHKIQRTAPGAYRVARSRPLQDRSHMKRIANFATCTAFISTGELRSPWALDSDEATEGNGSLVAFGSTVRLKDSRPPHSCIPPASMTLRKIRLFTFCFPCAEKRFALDGLSLSPSLSSLMFNQAELFTTCLPTGNVESRAPLAVFDMQLTSRRGRM